MKIRNLKIATILALSIPLMVQAEPFTLMQVFERAKSYDATLKAAVAQHNAQKEEINKSFAAFLPQVRLSASEGRGITDSETKNSLGNTIKNHRVYDMRNYSLSVRQTIFNRATFAEYAQSKAEVASSDATLEKEQLGLIGRVSEAYFNLLLAGDNVHYSDAQKVAAQQQLAQAEKRYKTGSGTLTEVSEAKANLETVTAQRLDWLNSLEYAKRTLETICGVYIDQFFTLDPNKLVLKSPEPASVEEWIALSMKKNPEIQAAMHDMTAADEQINKNNSGHFPTLDLVASRTKSESDSNITIGSKFDTDSLSLQLNVPIYSGGYYSAAVRQAESQLIYAQEKLADKQRHVSNDVRKYFNEIVSGNARVEAQMLAVQSNETAALGTQKGFEAGLRSNVEVLNAQDKLFSSIRDLAKERYRLLYSRLMLKQVTGTLQDSDLSELNQMLTALPSMDN
ncbi:MAG: channel protein TolC [Methylophilaceae bacterium]|nr:channel protein TolC [Methylophilaceae bacterium]